MLQFLARLFSPEVQSLTAALDVATRERDWNKQLADTYKAERDQAMMRERSLVNKIVKMTTGDAAGLPVEQPKPAADTPEQPSLYTDGANQYRLSEEDREVLRQRANEYLAQKGVTEPTEQEFEVVYANMLNDPQYWLSDN